jgi:hypothetical protein
VHPCMRCGHTEVVGQARVVVSRGLRRNRLPSNVQEWLENPNIFRVGEPPSCEFVSSGRLARQNYDAWKAWRPLLFFSGV